MKNVHMNLRRMLLLLCACLVMTGMKAQDEVARQDMVFSKSSIERPADRRICYLTSLSALKQELRDDMRKVVVPVFWNKSEAVIGRPLCLEGKKFAKARQRAVKQGKGNAAALEALSKYLQDHGMQTSKVNECEVVNLEGSEGYKVENTDSIQLPSQDDFEMFNLSITEGPDGILSQDMQLASYPVCVVPWYVDIPYDKFVLSDYFNVPQTFCVRAEAKRCKVDLRFDVAKVTLASDPQNTGELQKIVAEINKIQQKNERVLILTLKATSSPEGNYQRNIKLCGDRLRAVMATLRGMDAGNYERRTEVRMAGWDDVANLMRADGLTAEADEVDAVVKAHSSVDAQSRLIARKPFYKTIRDSYLPHLRRMDYLIDYTGTGTQTYDEVKQRYEADTTHLMMTLPLYYTLYKNEPDPGQRFQQMQDAVREYRGKRDCRMAANDLSIELNKRGTPDASILAPYIGTPEHKQHLGEYKPLVANYVMALLLEMKADSAQQVASQYLPYDEDTEMVHVMVGISNHGDYGYFDPSGRMGSREAYESASNQSEWHKVHYMGMLQRAGEAQWSTDKIAAPLAELKTMVDAARQSAQ